MKNLNSNLPPFYVGQKVEYIGTKHTKHIGKKGVVLYNFRFTCGCWATVCDFGSEYPIKICKCDDHNSNKVKYSGKHPLRSTNLRPLIEQTFPLMKYSEVIEKELISAN